MAAVQIVTSGELRAKRAKLLNKLDLTEDQLEEKVRTGGLVGVEWSVWAEIEEINYLLQA